MHSVVKSDGKSGEIVRAISRSGRSRMHRLCIRSMRLAPFSKGSNRTKLVSCGGGGDMNEETFLSDVAERFTIGRFAFARTFNLNRGRMENGIVHSQFERCWQAQRQ